MMQLRPYQSEAVDAVFDYWENGGGNPLVEMATGTGKSLVIATLMRRLQQDYGARVLSLVHVRELVSQNYQTLLRTWPEAPAGIYSAGLNRRDAHHNITFASIQSVHKKARQLGIRDVILIDEAHLVPAKAGGMYRSLLADLSHYSDVRVVGFSATPYRLDTGRLDKGKEAFFDDTVYSYGITKGIADGYLSPLVSKAGLTEIDVSNVGKRGGEFIAGQLELAADAITQEAVDELLQFGRDRKSWLIFCSGVKHAMNVRDALRTAGISCETVTGQTPSGERDSILRRFKNGEIKCLTNAQVLTTGFDAPNVDLVGFMRSTLSTSLYVQICGRGTRLHREKENCLVLDWGGNIRRHGPVDAVSVGGKHASDGDDTGKIGVDEVRAKTCPQCETMAALNAIECKECGHLWPRDEKPKHEAQAEAEIGILSTEKVKPVQIPVVAWNFKRHQKSGSPDSVCVVYVAGLQQYRQWLGFDHSGFFNQRALAFWSAHGGATPYPKSTNEALQRIDELTIPSTITVKPNGKYHDITGQTFAKKPELEVAE